MPFVRILYLRGIDYGIPRADDGEEEGEKEGDAYRSAERGPKSIGLKLNQLVPAPVST
jgi:hypothetical protein